jgi:hypothetical protein
MDLQELLVPCLREFLELRDLLRRRFSLLRRKDFSKFSTSSSELLLSDHMYTLPDLRLPLLEGSEIRVEEARGWVEVREALEP